MKRSMWSRRALVLALALLPGCSGEDSVTGMGGEEAALTATIRADYGHLLIPLPDRPDYPPDNGPSNAGFAARVELGRLMFNDPLLSGQDDVSCGHCHHPAFAWGDGRTLSIGVGGNGLGPDRVRTLPRDQVEMSEWEFFMPRNTPTLLDLAHIEPFAGDPDWGTVVFWDGRTFSLENQARMPLRNRDEMRHERYGGPDAVDSVRAELRRIPEYVDRFKSAFPEELADLVSRGAPETEVISANTYSRAISAFEREHYTADSPFDRFARGDDTALSLAQKRGLVVFVEAGCGDCHHGAMFSDFQFHALGVAQGGPGMPPIHEHGDGHDYGRYLETGNPADRFAFRTPSLRNVALTAPYFHTGGMGTAGDYQTLHQVVEFFDRGGNDLGLAAGELDPAMLPLALTGPEKDDLVAFLESLTGARLASPVLVVGVPESVPSGLDPPALLPPVMRN